MIRDAVTCDTAHCLAVFLERDAMPEGVEFETDMEAHGWTTTKAGHFCPACSTGRAAVSERGECPKCMGRTGWTVEGERCMGCGHVLPEPDDVEDELGDI